VDLPVNVLRIAFAGRSGSGLIGRGDASLGFGFPPPPPTLPPPPAFILSGLGSLAPGGARLAGDLSPESVSAS